MDRYIEKKRERRIRDFRRMVERAYEIFRRSYDVPSPGHGRHLRGDTWEDVFRARRGAARRCAENMTRRSGGRHGYGNPRRYWGYQTLQEKRGALAAVEQLIEMKLFDDEPVARKVGRRRPWV